MSEQLSKHRYAETLRLIADGVPIQFERNFGCWVDHEPDRALEEIATTEYAPVRYRANPDFALQPSAPQGMVPVAPWPDFLGQPIRHGDRLRNPDGKEFVAIRLNGFDSEGDAWRCIYDHDPSHPSRLCLQIGEKGRAVLTAAPSQAGEAQLHADGEGATGERGI